MNDEHGNAKLREKNNLPVPRITAEESGQAGKKRKKKIQRVNRAREKIPLHAGSISYPLADLRPLAASAPVLLLLLLR